MAVAVGSADEFSANTIAAMSQKLAIRAPSAAMRNSLTIALFTVLTPIVLSNLPFLDAVYGPVSGFLRGHVVLGAVLLNHLVGSFIPASFSPVSQITDLVEGFLNL